MSWGDRGWAPLDTSDRHVDDEPPAPRRGRRRLIAFAAVALLLGLVVAGYVSGLAHDAAHALRSVANQEDRRVTSTIGHAQTHVLAGPGAASVGGRYTISGRTGTLDGVHATGRVVLRGRWDGTASWLVLARADTDGRGQFTVGTRLDRRGTLHLRLATPDGYVATKTLRVN